MWLNPQFPEDLVAFTEETLSGNHFCPVKKKKKISTFYKVNTETIFINSRSTAVAWHVSTTFRRIEEFLFDNSFLLFCLALLNFFNNVINDTWHITILIWWRVTTLGISCWYHTNFIWIVFIYRHQFPLAHHCCSELCIPLLLQCITFTIINVSESSFKLGNKAFSFGWFVK